MGLRRFPPEVETANKVYWDYNEVRGTFITGRGSLDTLTEVMLNGNNIQVLPSFVGRLVKVHTFDLTGNLLRALPSSFGNMSSLSQLNLSRNRLTIISDSIGKCTRLVKLQLQENELEHVTEEISQLQGLEEISLSNNFLTSLPTSIPRITNLRNLLVTANDLQTDPSEWGVPGVSHELGMMPNLVELNVEQNEKLQVPPRDMWKGPSSKLLEFMRLVCDARETEHLTLHDMGLRSLPEVIILMDYLTSLSLCDNTLRAIPKTISNITSLTLLELDRNDLVMLPEDATKISNLTELRVSYNQMRGLPESCNRWIRVERIIATDNRIKQLPDGICEMPLLTELDLERNKLKTLPDAFTLCTSLTRLRFSTEDMVKASPAQALPSGIRRVEIPAEIAIRGVDEIIGHFFKMHRAWSTNSLDLSGFGLRTVMDDVCSLSVLTHLNLAKNRLRFLPSQFTQLRELRSVNLEDCYQLEYFHHHIHVLTKLKRVSIKGGALDNKYYPQIKMKWPPTLVAREPSLMRNYLEELNGCVGHRYTLKGIPYWDTTNRLDYRFVPHDPVLDEITTAQIPSVATRSFPNFPPEINELHLTALTELHLPGGQITADMMKKQLPYITKVKKLILVDQKITRICEEITLLQALEVLTLTGNRIKELPEYLFDLITLRKLVFVENHIQKIPPEISKLTNLTDLVLTYNRIGAVPKEIGELVSLDYLVLDENRIRVIPDAIQNLTSLREFSFNDNKITRFPMSMGALTQLEILEFGQNPPFSLPPSEVLKCDVSVIIDFMKRIWDCTITHKLNFRNFELTNKTMIEIIKEIEQVCWELNISKNNLEELPFELKKLTNLTGLNVSDNKYKNLNLAIEVEVAAFERKDKQKSGVEGKTLYVFFEELEMLPIYEIFVNEYDVKKLQHIKKVTDDPEKVDQLGLLPDEREKLLDAVDALPPEMFEEAEEEVKEQSEDGLEEEEENKGGEEEDEDKEEMDEEEAARLLQEAQGPGFKFNADIFRQMAYDSKVAFFKAVVSAKAKWAERTRRKELIMADQKVLQKASGFKRKVKRLEGAGVPQAGKGKKKKKRTAAQFGMSEEERIMKEAEAQERREKFLAERDAKRKNAEGDVDAIELKQEAGGGIVQQNIYSVAIFTALTDLRARRNELEYLPEDIGDLSALTKLDISHNEIRWIPPSFTKLVKLKELDLRHNHFFELPKEFGACSSIEELVLDHNKFYDLPESMTNMPRLRSLSLDHNEYMLLPAWIDRLRKLDTITFSFNKVKKLPNNFMNMANLTELRFSHNDFSQVPFLLSHLGKLKVVDMSSNPMGHLPDCMGGCGALEELYINDCAIVTMGIDIAKCKKLKVFEFDGNDDMSYPPHEVQLKGQEGVLRYFRQILDCPHSKVMMIDDFELAEVDNIIFRYPLLTWLDISKNNLVKVPAELRQLQHIESLNVSRNKLGCIPRIISLMPTLIDLNIDANGVEHIEPSIKLLTGLTRLSLATNRINSMHPSLFRLSSLTILNLTDNKIPIVPPDIALLEGLITLGLGDNEIAEVPDEIRYLQALRQLVLFGNKITHLPEGLRRLWQLEVLTVSQNDLHVFPPQVASDLTELKELWLGHNKITKVPTEIENLQKLEQLWLQDNQLEAIPSQVGNLTKLKVLTLTGNRIKEVPRSVKQLKIATNADQDKGEEYWQDKERDTFTEGDAEDDDASFRSWNSQDVDKPRARLPPGVGGSPAGAVRIGAAVKGAPKMASSPRAIKK